MPPPDHAAVLGLYSLLLPDSSLLTPLLIAPAWLPLWFRIVDYLDSLQLLIMRMF